MEQNTAAAGKHAKVAEEGESNISMDWITSYKPLAPHSDIKQPHGGTCTWFDEMPKVKSRLSPGRHSLTWSWIVSGRPYQQRRSVQLTCGKLFTT